MTAGDLLQWLGLAVKTGTLVVSHKGIEKKVFFRNGRVISSASSDPREYLGQFLMSYGYINEEELMKAMEVQRQSNILLGKILVTIGAISEEALVRLMRLKAEEEIYDIFFWQEGEFQWTDDNLPTMTMIALEVDLAGVIMEGSRRTDEWTRIAKVVPSGEHVPVIRKPINLNGLTEQRKMIAQAINGLRSIEEIVLESRSSRFNVSKAVFDLENEGFVDVHPPKLVSRPEDEVATAAVTPIADLIGLSQKALRSGDYQAAMRSLRAASEFEPDNEKVRNAMKGAETVILSEIRNSGLVAEKVPNLSRSFEEMADLDFSPNEGFILSRIDGKWNFGSIAKISPMREIDAYLIFHRLVQRKIIELS